MMNGIYLARSWTDVVRFLECILNGNDYLKPVRMKLINEGAFEKHKHATSKILQQLKYRDEEKNL
jgi:hypothetical protein